MKQPVSMELSDIETRVVRDHCGYYDSVTMERYQTNRHGLVIIHEGMGYDPHAKTFWFALNGEEPCPCEDYNARLQREAHERREMQREATAAVNELYLAVYRSQFKDL